MSWSDPEIKQPPRSLVTWHWLIEQEMQEHGDEWANVVSVQVVHEDSLNRLFDDGYGSHGGDPFTVWTETRVYFPVQYDGAVWAGSVSRHPDGQVTEPVGGG